MYWPISKFGKEIRNDKMMLWKLQHLDSLSYNTAEYSIFMIWDVVEK